MKSILFTLATLAIADICPAQEAAKPLTLSLGSVKERAEAATVRALVKYANRKELEDALVSANGSSFYVIKRNIDLDVTDKGTLGGLAVRYGAVRFSPTREDAVVDGVRVTQSAAWIHTIPVTLGLDADRSFQNRDYLFEAGYVPFKGSSGQSCFKLGGNPIVGVIGQLGHRTRENPTAGFNSSLRRIKVEMKSAFEIGRCFGIKPATGVAGTLLDALGTDLAKWRIIIEANTTRDFSERISYNYVGLTVRIPMNDNTYFDFKRDHGSTAPNFEKKSQYGIYITTQY